MALIGFLTADSFMEFSFKLINLARVSLVVDSIKDQFNQNLIFSFCLGICPLLIFLIKKLGRIKTINQTIASVNTMLIFGVLFWASRLLFMKMVFDWAWDTPQEHFDLPIGFMEFYEFFGYGITTGALLALIIFRFKNKVIKQENILDHN